MKALLPYSTEGGPMAKKRWILREPEPSEGTMPASVYVVEPLGSEKILDLKLDGAMIKARVAAKYPASVGQRCSVRFERVRLFEKTTGKAI